MNVILFSPSFQPAGSRELALHYLAQGLTALGHDATIFSAARGWRNGHQRFDYDVRRFPVIIPRLLAHSRFLQSFQEAYLLRRLLREMQSRRCDVLHAHAAYPLGYAGAHASAIVGVPLVVTPDDADIHDISGDENRPRWRNGLAVKIEQTIRRASALTVAGCSVEDSLIQGGIDPSRIHVIENGVDIARFQRPIKADVRGWLGIPKSATLIVTVANHRARAGYESLLRALGQFPALPGLHLVIVGRDREKLLPLIRAWGLENRVSFTGCINGPVHREETDWLTALYQQAALYVSAAAEEGAGGTSPALLEAMAAGLCVIATDIPPHREVVRQGENGILVAPAREEALAGAMEVLLADNDLQRKLSDGARRTAARLDWMKIAERYLSVYKSVLRWGDNR